MQAENSPEAQEESSAGGAAARKYGTGRGLAVGWGGATCATQPQLTEILVRANIALLHIIS